MQVQNYPIQAAERSQTLFECEVTLDASAPALGEGANKVFSAIARDSAGKFTLTLRKKWARIVPVGCQLLGEAVEFAKVFDVTDGAAATNTVEVGTFKETTGTTAFDDPTAARTCHLTFLLQSSKRRV